MTPANLARRLLGCSPWTRDLGKRLYAFWLSMRYRGPRDYWTARYRSGGLSGSGSYGPLAAFKAEMINGLIVELGVQSVIEFGCGDGNQLNYMHYPRYTGYDISPEALDHCRQRFTGDSTKEFLPLDAYDGRTADLVLSLDVIYHLTDDTVYAEHMRTLFAAARRWVLIYSSNTDEQVGVVFPHIRHRHFSAWIDRHAPDWRLARHIPNRFPFNGDERTSSFADFYLYERSAETSGRTSRPTA